HPLEGRDPSLADLAAYPWIVAAPGAPLRSTWEQMFAEAGLEQPPVPIESGSVMIIRQLLIHGDHLALLSLDQVAVELEAQWLVALRSAPEGMERSIGVSTRASWRPTAVQAEFIEDLEAVAA
ncbi:MAG: LysR family transcriptional regulator, partial [Novosphingobium sp.]